MLKVSIMAQVIKKYIYLSGAKSNDPLHIVYVPNVFKFTEISAKGTEESLKRYERTQKHRRRPSLTTSKIFTATIIFTATYICNNPRMASLHYFHFFINCRNYFPCSDLLFFYF